MKPSPTEEPAARGPVAVELLRQPGFAGLWASNAVVQLAVRTYVAMLLVAVFQQEGSAESVGRMLISIALPSLVIGPLAGVFVDRWERRRLMMSANLVRAGAALWLAWNLDPLSVLTCGFVLGMAERFYLPALRATVPDCVGPDRLIPANSLISATGRVMQMIGPAIGGALMAWLGRPAFLVLAGLFVSGAAAILLTRTVERPAPPREQRFWAELRDGLGYLLRSRQLLGIFAMIGIVNVTVGANNVLVVLLAEQTGAGPAGLGALLSALAVGMLGGFLLLSLVRRRDPAWVILAGLATMTVALAATAVTTAFWLAAALRALMGLGNALFWGSYMAALQQSAGSAVRGRVMALFQTHDDVTYMLALALMGWVGDHWGMTGGYLLAALCSGAAGLGLLGRRMQDVKIREG